MAKIGEFLRGAVIVSVLLFNIVGGTDNMVPSDAELNLENRPPIQSEASDAVNNVIFPLKRTLRSLKDVNYELQPAEGRHKNNRQSYNYHSKPKRNQYNHHNRHSQNHRGKGGYSNSDSYNSKSGYSTNSNYDRARRGDYGDSDHKEYGGKGGNSYGGRKQGGSSYGGRSGDSYGGHGSHGGHHESGSGNHYGGSGGGHYQHSGGGGGHQGDYGDDAGSYLNSDSYR